MRSDEVIMIDKEGHASLQRASYSRRTQATMCVSEIQVTERVVGIGS